MVLSSFGSFLHFKKLTRKFKWHITITFNNSLQMCFPHLIKCYLIMVTETKFQQIDAFLSQAYLHIIFLNT